MSNSRQVLAFLCEWPYPTRVPPFTVREIPTAAVNHVRPATAIVSRRKTFSRRGGPDLGVSSPHETVFDLARIRRVTRCDGGRRDKL